jgi:hypothetical protein
MSDDYTGLTPAEELLLRTLRKADAERAGNKKMDDLIRSMMAEARARERAAGPPSRERCLAIRERLRGEGRPAGYKSVWKALQADDWTVTLDQVRYRLQEPQP